MSDGEERGARKRPSFRRNSRRAVDSSCLLVSGEMPEEGGYARAYLTPFARRQRTYALSLLRFDGCNLCTSHN
jgi:hypothetical protein